MRAKFKLENPDEMLATVRITMTIKEWRELKKQLPEKYPSWDLSSIIYELINQAEKSFYSYFDKLDKQKNI